MGFKDLFKEGDIVRRGGYIRTGQLMIIESFEGGGILKNRGFFDSGPQYTAQDMFLDNQKWAVSEEDEFTLATDEDIISGLVSRLDTEEIFDDFHGSIIANTSDDTMFLTQDYVTISLDPISALQLQDYINNYVKEL